MSRFLRCGAILYMAKSGNNKNKGMTITAYLLCLLVLGLSVVYTIKNSKTTDGAEQTGELPVGEWESDKDAKEGSVDKIVTQVFTDPSGLDPGPFDPAPTTSDEPTVQIAGTQPMTEEIPVNVDTPSSETSEENIDSDSAADYSEYNMLELDGHTISTAVDWHMFDTNMTSPSELNYTAGIFDVTIALKNGSIEDYKPLIEAKASELNAGLIEENYIFSPTRVYDSIDYDKYTLVYTKDDVQYAAYYFLSQADDNYIYMATIRGTDELTTDSDVFGVLDYKFN